MFVATCDTCQTEVSFDEYSEANDWWCEHADDGHIVELAHTTEVATESV